MDNYTYNLDNYSDEDLLQLLNLTYPDPVDYEKQLCEGNQGHIARGENEPRMDSERGSYREIQSYSHKVTCNVTWDGLSCWPATLASTTQSIPCSFTLEGLTYDTSCEYLHMKTIENLYSLCRIFVYL